MFPPAVFGFPTNKNNSSQQRSTRVFTINYVKFHPSLLTLASKIKCDESAIHELRIRAENKNRKN